jgi:hypothetical protein
MKYAQVFNHLCQYAGYHADTDARKRDHFRRGLNTKLKERLNLVKADTFNELVNMAITQEGCISAHRAEKKRKTPTGPSTAQPPRYRLVQTTATRALPQNNLLGRWVARPPQQAQFNRPPTPQPQQQQQQAHGRAFRHPTKEITIIVVSTAVARPTSLRIVLNPGNLSKGKHPN